MKVLFNPEGQQIQCDDSQYEFLLSIGYTKSAPEVSEQVDGVKTGSVVTNEKPDFDRMNSEAMEKYASENLIVFPEETKTAAEKRLFLKKDYASKQESTN